MDSSKGNAAGRIFNERLADKIPAPIPETPTAPTHLTVDTEAAAHNASNPPALARPNGQKIEELTYTQRFALRTLPGMVHSIHREVYIY